MLKKIGIGLVVLIVLVAVGAYFLFSNIDSIIKAAIEKYGTAATQAEVTLDKVNLSLTTGEGGLIGLKVGNPKGFATPDAIVCGTIDVKLDTNSVTGSGPVLIHEITIDKPAVTYERTDSGSNIDTIQQNTAAYAGGGGKASSGGGGRKVIIENLYVRDGVIGISYSLLHGKTLTAPLPTIHLTNIGKNSGGATPAEVAEQVLGAVGSAASKVSVATLEKQFGSLKGLVGDQVKGVVPSGSSGVPNVGGSVKSLLGK
ncbi:MAG TPA: hypothetical protein VMU42_13850 [Candidatus Sulfotelmatobacter sp.]|nr:hypothetical protein [Candidatus Sulfotelmatobacter sp.]